MTTDTSATLSWQPPINDGGRRDDLFYTVKYKTLQEQQSTYYSPITDTSVTVTHLAPLTTYTFTVVAENKISEEFPVEFPESDRTSSSVSVTTKEGGE